MALRQQLDLYVCLRPVRYYQGTPSPVKQPELTDMVIFRENAEDIYAGIEWKAGSAEADKVIKFLRDEMGVKNPLPGAVRYRREAMLRRRDQASGACGDRIRHHQRP